MVKSRMDLLEFYLKVHDEMLSRDGQFHQLQTMEEKFPSGVINFLDVFNRSSGPVSVIPLYPNMIDFVHRHDFFEVVYLYRGSCTVQVGEQRFSLQAGDACIINVNVNHSFCDFHLYHDMIFAISINQDVLKSVYVDLLSFGRHEFFAGFFLQSLQKKNNEENFVVLRADSESDYEVYVRQILKNQIQDNLFKNDIITLLCGALLIEFARQYGKNVSCELVKEISTLSLSGIVEHISRNCRTVSIRSLAQQFGYTESYMSSFIKKSTGSSFSDILHSARFFAVLRLLSDTEKTVQEIMEEVGYTNRTWFTKKFAERFSCKPQEFRARIREKQKPRSF